MNQGPIFTKVFIAGLLQMIITTLLQFLVNPQSGVGWWLVITSVVIAALTYFGRNLRAQWASVFTAIAAAVTNFVNLHPEDPHGITWREIAVLCLTITGTVLGIFFTSPPKPLTYEEQPTIAKAKRDANSDLKKLSMIILIVCTSAIANAQYSPFHRLPKPKQMVKLGQMTPVPTNITAFRFTGPMAGFMYPQNQVVTGIGYGWQKLHYIDSTLKYYCDFSVSGIIYAGGNVQPSIQDNNIMSVGISLGFLNQLLMIGPVYNLPKDGNKGKFGVVANFAVPLNN